MSIFTKILAWCGGILITSTAVVTPCYYCIPEFKDAVNKNVLKIEQTATDTSEKDKKINELTLKLEEKTLAHEVLSADLLEEKEKVAELELSAQQDADTIATLQSSLTEKSNALNTALEEKDALMLEIETLESEKNNLSSQIEGLNSTIENNESEIAQLVGENTSLKEQKQILEDDLLANATQISELNSRIETNNARIEELENENSSKQSQIDNLTESIETLEDEKALLEGQVEEKDAEIAELQSQISILIEERDEAVSSLNEKIALITEKDSRIAELENNVSLKEIEIASLNEEIEQLEQTLDNSHIIQKEEGKEYFEDIVDKGFDIYHCLSNKNLLASSSSRSGLYLVNTFDYSATMVYSKGSCYKNFFELPNGKVLFTSSSNHSSSKGVHILDLLSLSATQLYTDSSCYNYDCFFALSNNNAFISSSASNMNGLLYYEDETNSIVKVYSSGYGFKYFYDVGNGKVLFSSGYNNSSSIGLYLFDTQTKEVSKIFNTGFNYTNFIEVDNKILITCALNQFKETLVFDKETNTASLLSETMRAHSVIETKDGFLISCGDNNGGCGLLYYSLISKEFVTVSTVGYYYKALYSYDNGLCLLECYDGSNGKGLYLYDSAVNELTHIYGNTTNWSLSCVLKNGDLIIVNSYSSYGTLYFSCEARTIEKILDIKVQASYVLKDNKALLSCSGGIYLLDGATKNCLLIFETNAVYKSFIEDENGVTLVFTGTNANPSLYYSYDTGEITEIE